jgi:hypothetical protein
MYRSNALADKQEMSPDLDSSIQSGANEAFAELDLVDLNVILHRADGEEKDATGMYLPSVSSASLFLSCFPRVPPTLRPLAFLYCVVPPLPRPLAMLIFRR